MRTLLVDNYDSFTYNLCHYLTEVNGCEPVVVHNDEPGWDLEALDGFDNVVLSPGPGTPARAGDFGVCAAILASGRVPVLGVCLGHQGIALLAGGAVGHAPEPRHGRVSLIEHTGRDLFAGLPSPFQAVRYHSLAVTEVPAEIEPLAWTRDGVLMGLRHRRLPLWGVQFHPESICTEYGHDLLRNFRDLTARWRRGHGLAPRASRAPAAAPAAPAVPAAPGAPAGGGRRLRVLVETLPTDWHDEVVFDALFRGSGRNAFWLDSSRRDGVDGRFSIMGDDSGPLARVATADVWTETVTVRSAGGVEVVSSPFLGWLDADLAGLRVEAPELPFGFTLGWVGYLGYELKAECGGERVHRSTEPDAAMVFADRAIVFDHESSTTYLLALTEPGGGQGGDGGDAAARGWLRGTVDRLMALAGRGPAGEGHPTPLPDVRLRHGRRRYLDLIGASLEAITDGETYEICLTNMVEARGQVPAWPSYQFLRRMSPAPFAAFLQFGSFAVLSTSPERFLRVAPDRTVESRPIKGTRPRGADPVTDELLREDLRTNEKDRAENLMIVDLVRHDLSRCAEVGSVHVHKMFDVESFATVHQLVSTVRATLRADSSAAACVRAAFPGGSMTGAPKIRTMRIIDRLEAGPRGVYSGAIGYLSLTGTADLSIVIRTAVVSAERVTYGVGGAIVALSEPEAEYEETAVKAAPILRLLAAEFPDRQPVPGAAG